MTYHSNRFSGFKVVAVMFAIAGLSMGNEGCEKEQTAGRNLKMEVELGALKGKSIRMPTGEVIDFAYIANALFYRQVYEHNHFVMLNPVPTADSYASQGGSFKMQGKLTGGVSSSVLAESDVDVLEQYGFLRSVRMRGEALASGMAKASDIADDQMPACLYDLPQVNLGGEVISFEATWGAGLGIGYNSGGDLAGNAGGRIDFSQSKLEIGLRTDDPLTQQMLVIGDGVSHQSNVKFGFDFIPGIPIGLNFFFNTPITDVIRSAMTKGLDNIVGRYTKMMASGNWNEAWESRVIYDNEIANNDTHVAIRGGYRAGVQKGDRFALTNLHYRWEGAPCYTRLKSKITETVTPIAEGVVVNVGDNVAVLEVKYVAEGRVRPGAQVKLIKLFEPAPEKK